MRFDPLFCSQTAFIAIVHAMRKLLMLQKEYEPHKNIQFAMCVPLEMQAKM